MLSRLKALRLSLLPSIPYLSNSSHSSNTHQLTRTMSSQSQQPTNTSIEQATFASGCFWGTEHIFLTKYPIKDRKGIVKTRVGFTGGNDDVVDPGYRLVCTGLTGHVEAVRIEFEPEKIGYGELVEYFYRTHDPTTVNSQGPDVGTQYRSAIFYHSPEQKEIAEQVTQQVQQKHFDPIGKKIVTSIEPAKKFYDAEDYHQEYLFKNPNGYQCPTHKEHW